MPVFVRETGRLKWKYKLYKILCNILKKHRSLGEGANFTPTHPHGAQTFLKLAGTPSS